jgi:adenylate cyclase
MSVLFTDIVGFTGLAQDLTPRQVIELLNDYFDVLCPIIKDHGGDIDKFIGDAIMAVFDVERDRPPPAVRATRSALAMQEALRAFNAHSGRPALGMRIGVNTGPLVRGDLGSRVVRRDYTVIGDTVNRANRYESACPPGRVMVSESTRAQLGDGAAVEAVPGLSLKGVVEPVTGYVVMALPGDNRDSGDSGDRGGDQDGGDGGGDHGDGGAEPTPGGSR